MTPEAKIITFTTIGAVLIWFGVIAFLGLQIYMEMPR